ncbi:hypothetical protein FCV67_27540, partial [Vibrio sp. F13]
CVVGLMITSSMYSPDTLAKTVNLTAEKPVVVESVTTWDKTAQWWWDLWLTPDQQGQRLLNQKEYLQAAKHFTDPMRKGAAYY